MSEATTVMPDDAHRPGKIGPYRVLELLGSGGMGEVYKAEQRQPIKRTVAIKIIKLGFDSREVIARFESERQALARMDHPHVARVLDAGVSETGRPFFVMEYVPGKPITQFADDNKLSIKERLELFTQACNAIAHAHSKAIIHRDIKAANVLAFTHDDTPTVKVIDFGIAKALTGDRLTDATFNTQSGKIIGTYEAMSPEQADGSRDIDTRTDVYSLGVLLYELLAGAKPFDHDTFNRVGDQEIKRIIREVEPPRPSMRLTSFGADAERLADLRRSRLESLEHQLRTELEWIPLKAMRKERARRYESPLQLKDDIQNYLDGRPLIAGPESRAYKLRKFIRRNRRAVIASAMACILLVVGVSFYVYNIGAEKRRTELALKQAQDQASIAKATETFLSEMLASADPENLRGSNVTVLQAVQAAAKALDAGKLREQPLTEAAVRTTIGNTLQGLGEYDAARPHLQIALDIRRRNLPEGNPDIASSLNSLAWLLQQQGKPGDAEPLYREAIQINRNPQLAGGPRTGAPLNNLALLLRDRGQLAQAEPLFREALAIERSVLPAGDPMITQVVNNLAVTLGDLGRTAEAEPLYREALETNRRVLPPGHPEIAKNLNNFATFLENAGKPQEAEALFREALAIDRKALPAGHREIANLLNNLAWLLQHEGKWDEAESMQREALEIDRKALPEGHPGIARTLSNLGLLLKGRGKLDEAESLFREALAINRKALPADHPDLAAVLSNLASLLRRQGKLPEAELLLREVLAQAQKSFPQGDRRIADAQLSLAGFLTEEGRLAEAEALARESLVSWRKLLAADSVDLAAYIDDVAYVLRLETKFGDAEVLYRESLAIRRKALPAGHVQVAINLSNLGGALVSQGKFIDAEPLLEEANRIAQAADFPPKDSAMITSRFGLCLMKLGKFEQAGEPLRRAYDGMVANGLQSHPRFREVITALIEQSERTNHPDEASKWRATLAQLNVATQPTSNPATQR